MYFKHQKFKAICLSTLFTSKINGLYTHKCILNIKNLRLFAFKRVLHQKQIGLLHTNTYQASFIGKAVNLQMHFKHHLLKGC